MEAGRIGRLGLMGEDTREDLKSEAPEREASWAEGTL